MHIVATCKNTRETWRRRPVDARKWVQCSLTVCAPTLQFGVQTGFGWVHQVWAQVTESHDGPKVEVKIRQRPQRLCGIFTRWTQSPATMHPATATTIVRNFHMMDQSHKAQQCTRQRPQRLCGISTTTMGYRHFGTHYHFSTPSIQQNFHYFTLHMEFLA